MKISKPLKKQKLAEKISGNKKGVALVLVLTVMSLATIMILTFFSLATSEHRSSATYSQGLQAQQVAEQAVNLVISQIRAATAKSDVAWASQPGAIRTWASNGQFNIGYKLYSDDVLQEPSEPKLNDDDFKDAQNWSSRPDEFVDLNEPVIRGEKVYFPIVDPSARDLPKWPSKIGGETDDAGVEGFDFNFDSAHTISPGDYDMLVKAKNSVGHLALPVRWIYQLADGTLGTVTGGTFTALSGGITPSKDNQIVGRFAFWADDESAKLNLNTHCGGLAWDTPRVGGDLDMDMARFQPLQREWQRYPGHPATTHLVPALAPGVLDIVRNKNAMEMIFATVPRIVGGGSESGTRKANPSDPKENNGLIADNNPLFPSVDEYVMAPDRKPTNFPQANGRPASEETMVDMMERVRFFLTTTSRAPETTLFNTPRIAVWPVNRDKTKLTPFDNLIQFCSTVGRPPKSTRPEDRFRYIFERMNADSSKDDLYHDDMKRNLLLYRYLAKLTAENIPGVGAGFDDKYAENDRYQILTQIFDYIRSTNLHDDSLFGTQWNTAFKVNNTSDHVTYTNPRKGNPDKEIPGQSGIHKGHGQVTPIEITEGGVTTKGFGRFYTLKDVGIHVICAADGGSYENRNADWNLGQVFNPQTQAGRLGGQGAGHRNPGYRVYGGAPRQGLVEGALKSNLPPLPAQGPNGKEPRVDDPLSWPTWLVDWMDANDPFPLDDRMWDPRVPPVPGMLNGQQRSFLKNLPINPFSYVTATGTLPGAQAPDPFLNPPIEPLRPGNWRQRFMWREAQDSPADREDWWEEVEAVVAEAFKPENWNWNLMFNRVRIFERDNRWPASGDFATINRTANPDAVPGAVVVYSGPFQNFLHHLPRIPDYNNSLRPSVQPYNPTLIGELTGDTSQFLGVDVTVDQTGNPLNTGDWNGQTDPGVGNIDDVDERNETVRNGNNRFNRRAIHYNDVMHLGPNEKLVQAALIFNLFCPSDGWVPINPDMSIQIEMEDEGGGGTGGDASIESQEAPAPRTPFKFVTLGPGGSTKGVNRDYFYGSQHVDPRRYGRFLVNRDFEGDPLGADFNFNTFFENVDQDDLYWRDRKISLFINQAATQPPNDQLYWNYYTPGRATEKRDWWFTNDVQTAYHHRHSGGVLPFTYVMASDHKNTSKIGRLQNLGGVEVRSLQNARTTGRFTPLESEYYSGSSLNNRYSFITPPFRIGPTQKGKENDPFDGRIVESPNPGIIHGFVPTTERLVEYMPNVSDKLAYKLVLQGGDITFKIHSGGTDNDGDYGKGVLTSSQSAPELVQEVKITVPDFEVYPPALAFGREGYINEFKGKESEPVNPMEMWSLGVRGACSSSSSIATGSTSGRMYRISSANGQLLDEVDVVQSISVLHGDVRIPAVRKEIRPSSSAAEEIYGPHFRYSLDKNKHYFDTVPPLFFPENSELDKYVDVPYRGVPNAGTYDPASGEPTGRVWARMAHDFATSPGWRYEGGDGRFDNRYAATNADAERSMSILPGINYAGKVPANPIGERSRFSGLQVNKYGDFDNGMGLLVDGPYINKPDEGNSHSLYKRTDNRNPNAWDLRRDYGDFPYFVRDWLHEAGGPSYFSPNRVTSGPGMFGSLPTGAMSNKPWQTLLFRPHAGSGHPGAPAKSYNGTSIPGGRDPADHYWMDLFWMPVVEPYAISEPLSTAGKVNLNYQILPFRNVKRNTSMRGIFRSELMVLIPTVGYDPQKPRGNGGAPSLYAREYKHNSGRGSGWHWRDRPNGGFLQGKRLRAVIQEPRTLEQFQQRFDAGKIFKSASEICEVHLVPQQVAERMGVTSSRNQLQTYTPEVAQMESGKFWKDHAAIGDNSRERPYGNIYSRVTTKSNTFKVHYRGQVLKQGRRLDNNYSKWDPELDSVVGEYRGSSIVERYLDPNSDQIIDYALAIGGSSQSFQQVIANPNYHTIDDYHRFRIVNPTRFAP